MKEDYQRTRFTAETRIRSAQVVSAECLTNNCRALPKTFELETSPSRP